LDIQRLTAEQREELIEDLMALKDAVEEEDVLDVEEVNTDICEPIDASPLSPSTLDRTTQPWKPKWEKRLPKQLSVNTLDACGMSIILPIYHKWSLTYL